MNRDEKNLQTRQRILDSALQEFGAKSYGEASLNTVCAAGNVSKGIIYHYFKDKDELYLMCVQKCFEALTQHISDTVPVDSAPLETALERYFDARIAFFAQQPVYQKLFCNALFSPPAHLHAAIDEIAAEFRAQSVSILTALLGTVKLRSDITLSDVVNIFCEYQDFVNSRFEHLAAAENTLQAHEARCRRSLQIMLYGVIERKE